MASAKEEEQFENSILTDLDLCKDIAEFTHFSIALRGGIPADATELPPPEPLPEPETTGSVARQNVILRQGIDSDLARKLVKLVKGSKLKVQVAIQGDELRVTGKKRDDLQSAISHVKGMKLDLPLQFVNMRD
mgnify:CR=1 FL=1